MTAPSISINYNNILCSLNDKGKNGTATFFQYNMVNTNDQDHIPGLPALWSTFLESPAPIHIHTSAAQ